MQTGYQQYQKAGGILPNAYTSYQQQQHTSPTTPAPSANAGTGYQQYKEQSVNTMTSAELLMKVLDALVTRTMRAEMALKTKNYPLFEESVKKSLEIVRHLDDTLDLQYEVGRNLHRMYDFFSYELNRVLFGRNLEELERIRPMMVDLRDSFRTASASSKTEDPAPAEKG